MALNLFTERQNRKSVAEIEQGGLVVEGIEGGGAIGEEKGVESPLKGSAGSGLTAEVGDDASNNKLLYSFRLEGFFQRGSIKGIVLGFTDDLRGEGNQWRNELDVRVGFGHQISPPGFHAGSVFQCVHMLGEIDGAPGEGECLC